MRPFSSLKNLRFNSQGMTLIEIMIVMVIVGGLLSIVGGKVLTSFKKSRISQAKIQMGELSKGLGMYYTDCQQYPTALKGLMEATAECKNWGPEPYVKKSLMADPWNHEFVYEVSGSEFKLKSYGQDGKEGGTGLDADIEYEQQ